MNEKTSKMVGVGLMVPLVGLAIYVVMNPKIWIAAILAAVFGAMFAFGLKLVKGKTVQEAGQEVVAGIKDKV